MATRLKKVKVNEVSLVTRPAINRQFLLYKSEDGMEEENMVEEIVKTEETPVVEEQLVTEPVAEVTKEEAPVVEEPVAEVVKEETPVVEPVVEVAKEEPAPEPAPIVEKAKPKVCSECGEEMGEEEGEMHKGCGEKGKIKKEMEDISKALEQERIEKAAIIAELAELRKAAEIAKQVEITKAFIHKAATELKDVPTMVPETFGPVLKAAADKLDKAEFDAIYSMLVAASNFINKNATLTKELGVGGQDLSADPAAQLDSIAKSYVVKDTQLTYAKAYSMACDQNPHIYAQHVKQARNR
jgi:predicted nucleic acid-binding protein